MNPKVFIRDFFFQNNTVHFRPQRILKHPKCKVIQFPPYSVQDSPAKGKSQTQAITSTT